MVARPSPVRRLTGTLSRREREGEIMGDRQASLCSTVGSTLFTTDQSVG